MIPGPFEYHRPASLAEATGLLVELGDDARVLAGGHSLIPMMKLRMAAPEHLVDLQDIAELKGITSEGGEIVIGAMATQHELIASDELASAVPLIREAALQIADPQVRYLGTLGGNVANGDPGNDMPGLMQCLGAAYDLDALEIRDVLQIDQMAKIGHAQFHHRDQAVPARDYPRFIAMGLQ